MTLGILTGITNFIYSNELTPIEKGPALWLGLKEKMNWIMPQVDETIHCYTAGTEIPSHKENIGT